MRTLAPPTSVVLIWSCSTGGFADAPVPSTIPQTGERFSRPARSTAPPPVLVFCLYRNVKGRGRPLGVPLSASLACRDRAPPLWHKVLDVTDPQCDNVSRGN